MILYNMKTDGDQYRITKFDSDLNPIPDSSYLVSVAECQCPAGSKDTCRHRTMLPEMLPRVDTFWFYCFEDKNWYDPTGAYAVETPEETAAKEAEIAPNLSKLAGMNDLLEAHSSMVEPKTLNLEVEGSSPSVPANSEVIRRRV